MNNGSGRSCGIRRRVPRGRRGGGGYGRGLTLEASRGRALLSTATETFNGPSLSGLIQQAEQGKDTSPQVINQMLSALEGQLTGGPLADLSAGTVDGDGFVVEVQSLETSFEANVDQQLSPEFPPLTSC